MHVGSTTAICSKEPVTSDKDTTYRPNKLQKALLGVWYDCIDEITQTPDVVVINGEPCDGGNKNQLGNQSWTTNLYDQIVDSRMLVKEIQYKNILVNRGSAYHVQLDGTNFDEVFAREINADRYRTFGGSGYTDYYILLEMNGKHFNFTHHIGFNKWAAYRTTALAREMAGMVFEYGKMGKSDIIVRSHVHYYVHIEFVHTHGITTPAWKYPDGHLFRGGTAGTTPDIGMVEVIIEPNGDIDVVKHIAEMQIKPLVKHY